MVTAGIRRPLKGDPITQLSQFPIFASLGTVSLQYLAEACHRKSWSTGELIFQRGDDGEFMLAILTGRIRLSMGSAAGKELVLRHLEAGDILGELALIDGQTRSADAAALEPTSAIVIRRDRFQQIAAKDPSLGMSLAKYVCSLLRSTNFQMESIALYDLQMRVVRFFLFLLGQTHGEAVPRHAELRLSFNQTDLSALLGASRPKINQVLQSLIAEGVITREGDMVRCDVELLQSIADVNVARGAS